MGEKIKKARMKKKLTLEKLSEQVGISRNFLWEIEAGRKTPAIQTLYNISKELKISVDYIFGLSNERKWIEDTPCNDTLRVADIILELDSREKEILYALLKTYLKNK